MQSFLSGIRWNYITRKQQFRVHVPGGRPLPAHRGHDRLGVHLSPTPIPLTQGTGGTLADLQHWCELLSTETSAFTL